MTPLRIAVLECDTPVDKINRKYNGYFGVFSLLLRASANVLNQPDRLDPDSGLDITRWDVVGTQEYPKLEDVDALLLTGSSECFLPPVFLDQRGSTFRRADIYNPEHNSFDNDPWILKLVEYMKSAVQDTRVKLLGICFGHQIIGRALGAKVGRSDVGWEIAVCDMGLTDQGKKLFGMDKLVSVSVLDFVGFSFPWQMSVLIVVLFRLSASNKCIRILSLNILRMSSR